MSQWQRNEQPNPFRDLENLLVWFKNNKSLVIIGAVLLLSLFVGSKTFYTVQPNEEAVVLRLGKYNKTSDPGLNFMIPIFDKVLKVKTSLIHQEEFGFRGALDQTSHNTQKSSNYKEEAITLTGDLNVAVVEWIVQYQISDPMKYLFNAKDPIQTIRDISQAIMRRVVGDRLVSEVLTIGRAEIASEAQKLTQEVLDSYNIGIRIVSVKLQDINPPDIVKPSFNEVNAAKQEQEEVINIAERKYNSIIPEAKGLAKKKIALATGYATEIINQAEGDVAQFNQIYFEYKKAPSITKKRLYIEKMQDIFTKLKKVTIVDEEVKGLLPIFGNKGSSSSSSAYEGGVK
ncbi:MAG: FtsH protease activity modulator HflK [Pseudomonadota bacterium]